VQVLAAVGPVEKFVVVVALVWVDRYGKWTNSHNVHMCNIPGNLVLDRIRVGVPPIYESEPVVLLDVDSHGADPNDNFALRRRSNLSAQVGGFLGPRAGIRSLLEVVGYLVWVYRSRGVPVLPVCGHKKAPYIVCQQKWTANSFVVQNPDYYLKPDGVDHFLDLVDFRSPIFVARTSVRSLRGI